MKRYFALLAAWRVLAFVFATCLCLSGGGSLRAQDNSIWLDGHEAHPTRLLARLAPTSKASGVAANSVPAGVVEERPYVLWPDLVVIEIDVAPAAAAARTASSAGAPGGGGGASALLALRLKERMGTLRASGRYTFVEPDYVVRTQAVPTDAAFTDGTLWGLRNTGQASGVAGADVDAVRAWDLSTGSAGVIVGVIDSGIRYTHRELASRMWRNPGESGAGRETNGIDDDADGYVDNVFGINAILRNGDPMDDNDHGTHCAGTIGAAAADGHPHVGVAWDVRLMGLKFLAANGSGSTSDAIRCIDFAVGKGCAS